MSVEIHFGHKPSPDKDPTLKLFKMPGGEWHVQQGLMMPDAMAWAFVQGGSADDLVALSIWADSVHRDGGHPRAIIPYLPGARQDRRRPGEALSCKVYADLINRCRFDRVVCLDPHSDVMPALIENASGSEEESSLYKVVWENGKFTKKHTFREVAERVGVRKILPQ